MLAAYREGFQGMSIVGDLERLFAALYPNRVAIAITGVVLLLGLGLLARRLGWFGSARRHPRASAGIVALILAVALPGGWYLGSPLFIRTELHEAPPVALAPASPPTPSSDPAQAVDPGPDADQAPSGDPSPSADPAPAATETPRPASPTDSPAPDASPTTLTGRFVGADDFHTGSGSAIVASSGPDHYVLRLEDFSVRNGPDLYVYLSPDAAGYAAGALELGRLKASDGSFNYAIPAGTIVDAYRSVVIWCKAFSVQFAHATLTAG